MEHILVYIITDMPRDKAVKALSANNIPFDEESLLCADWEAYGDRCKTVLMEEYEIDIMIDDRLDYIFEGVPIGLLVVPRPGVPYYDSTWVNPE